MVAAAAAADLTMMQMGERVVESEPLVRSLSLAVSPSQWQDAGEDYSQMLQYQGDEYDSSQFASADVNDGGEADRDHDMNDAQADVDEAIEGEEADSGEGHLLMLASASLEEILQQLTDVATHLLVNFRDMEAEGDRIQAELDQLHEAQDLRCQGMVERLQRAGNTIFAQSQTDDGAASQLTGRMSPSQDMELVAP